MPPAFLHASGTATLNPAHLNQRLERPNLYPEPGRSFSPSFLVGFDHPGFRHDTHERYQRNSTKGSHNVSTPDLQDSRRAMADGNRQSRKPEHNDDGLSSSKNPGTAHQRLAAPLSKIASDLFRCTIQHPDQLPVTVFRRIEREYGYFQLWCDGYNVLSGALDRDLVASKRLLFMTCRRISEVCQALTGSKFCPYPHVGRT